MKKTLIYQALFWAASILITAMMQGEVQESSNQIWLFQVILATLALGQLRQAAKKIKNLEEC